MSSYTFILDLLFPKQCVGCNASGSYLCDSCISTIKQTDLVCPMCERPSVGGVAHPVCRRRYGLDGLWSLGIYHDPLRKVIQKLKYKWVKECARSLISILLVYWVNHPTYLLDLIKKEYGESWVIVPVPLHKQRQNWRGFNQSGLLAQLLSQSLNISYQETLIRIRNTKPQVGLPSNMRKQNIRGAFALSENYSIREKNIILVDDVWTTGSTLKECCYVLKRGGAKSVWALTIAR